MNDDKMSDLARNLEFMPLSQRISELHQNHINKITPSRNGQQGGVDKTDITIVIVAWDWGRPKRECKGFGFCNVVWFPDFKEKDIDNNFENNASVLEVDSVGRLYTDLILSKPIDTSNLSKIPSLAIDMPLIARDTSNIHNDTTLIVPKGSVQFNPNIGNYGGYRVFLKKNCGLCKNGK